MKRLGVTLAACVLAAATSACQGGSVTEPDARTLHGPSYNGGMAGSGGYATTDGGGMAGSGHVTTTTENTDSTATTRGIGMAGSGH